MGPAIGRTSRITWAITKPSGHPGQRQQRRDVRRQRRPGRRGSRRAPGWAPLPRARRHRAPGRAARLRPRARRDHRRRGRSPARCRCRGRRRARRGRRSSRGSRRRGAGSRSRSRAVDADDPQVVLLGEGPGLDAGSGDGRRGCRASTRCAAPRGSPNSAKERRRPPRTATEPSSRGRSSSLMRGFSHGVRLRLRRCAASGPPRVDDVARVAHGADEDPVGAHARPSMTVAEQAGDVVAPARASAASTSASTAASSWCRRRIASMSPLGDQVGEPVAGEQDPVPAPRSERRIRSPVSSRSPLTLRSHDVAPRVAGHVLLGQRPLVDQALHVGVVGGDPGQGTVAEQVAARVAEVGRARTARRRWPPRSAWWPCRRAPGRGCTPAPSCSWASRTPAAAGRRVGRRVGQGHRRDDVRRGRGGDLAGGRATDAVGDEHAGRADEPGVLVAAADEADVADADTGEPQHVATPSPVQRPPTLSRFPRVSRRPCETRDPHTMGRMEWLLLAISVGLVLACGVFGAAEYSFVAVDRAAVEKAAGRGRPAGPGGAVRRCAVAVHPALRRPGRRHPHQPGDRLPRRARDRQPARRPARSRSACPRARSPGVSVALGLVLATVATMIFGELVPKKLGIAAPLPIARRTQGFMRGFTTVMTWPIQAAQRLGQRDRAGARASSRRRSSARRAPPTSWPRWPAARRARAPWTPRPPTWCSDRSPSARAPPARS